MSGDKQKTVLVWDREVRSADEFCKLIEFADYQARRAHDLKSLADEGVLDDVLALVVFQYEGVVDEMKALKKQRSNLPPIILVHDGHGQLESGLLGSVVMAHIKRDIKYHALSDILHRAEVQANGQNSKASRASKSDKNDKSLELFRSLVGNSRGIHQVRQMIKQVAPAEATVLILGESGTGKEVVARNIHYHSNRRAKPFVPINCGAIPSGLLESELFGHEKGAFSGAYAARQGRFELADGGTIFLDEIGDMPLDMQVKLLRVIQERAFERIGSNRSIASNVRIIAATHRDLLQCIEDGKFREDLYYRLNVFPIEMPRLRDRVEDLPLLVNELITRLEHEKSAQVRIAPSAIMAMCNYHWPGNVRELANLIERLSILFPYGCVDVKDLPKNIVGENAIGDEELPAPAANSSELAAGLPNLSILNEPRLPRDGIDLKKHLMTIEVSLINQALEECDWVVSRAAKRLHIRRTTLVEKMRKYRIERVEETS